MELVQKRETRKTEFPLILAPLLTVEECVHDFLTHGGVDIRQCHTALSPPPDRLKEIRLRRGGDGHIGRIIPYRLASGTRLRK
ncbi:hypothetical protein TGRH88_034280 [Toxoplasma gondii]|uniref:Uncharacterized protein n=1 Tax=Toxoplasma gondii TaxID=5811 RepID=A0A7J6K7M0_TOXGO|nr:hypothetical protein TGRH88_034280 [Toxoplasma gondii]